MGLTEAQIAEILGVSRDGLGAWSCAYARGGLKALPDQQTGHPVGSGRTLTGEQGRPHPGAARRQRP